MRSPTRAPEASKNPNRINNEIRGVPQVRLIGAEGEQIGVVSIREAQAMADEADLDLVEISAQADPPVCRVMDYGKYLFQTSKQKAEAKKNQRQMQVKEIKFRPGTDEGDYQVKLKALNRFLEEGDKAKITLRFRGREMAHQELGTKLLERVQNDLLEVGTVESFPKMEGRQMIMVIAPKKKK
ncbi:MAG: translation initiation factor IF-3 [Gammaproteobacteria bacterium]|nr:translation initiation factor IF-3 [Gammaproteobacteria bacterium]